MFERRSAITRIKMARAIQLRDKKPLGAAELFKLPNPHPSWWKIISDGAKGHAPYGDVVMEVTFESAFTDPSIPDFPAYLEDWDDKFPAIKQDEALALLDKFLHAERGRLLAGVSLELLHWLALAAYYCPKREPITALKELVASGRIQAVATGSQYEGLNWPLTITDKTIEEIGRERIQVHLPTFTKADRFLKSLQANLPTIFGLISKASKALRISE